MKTLPLVLVLLSAGLPPAPAAFAAPPAKAHAPAHPVQDPFAPVFLVSSRKTFDTIHALVSNPASRRDSLGNELIVSETRAHMLDAVSGLIHQRERRCGGQIGSRSTTSAGSKNRSAKMTSRAMSGCAIVRPSRLPRAKANAAANRFGR